MEYNQTIYILEHLDYYWLACYLYFEHFQNYQAIVFVKLCQTLNSYTQKYRKSHAQDFAN